MNAINFTTVLYVKGVGYEWKGLSSACLTEGLFYTKKQKKDGFLMLTHEGKIKKLTVLAMMIALDFVLSPLLRIEGMAPMSSVVNIIGAVLMGPFYATAMAFICGLLRMTLLSIPPLALTGAVFGAAFAGMFYRMGQKVSFALFGEMVGTGIVGSLLSYPVMVWFTGSHNQLFWFVYTPRFMGATLIGGLMAYGLLNRLQKISVFQKTQQLFTKRGDLINEQF